MLRGTVVVFTGTDIPPCPVEMNVQRAWDRLAEHESRDTRKVWTWDTGSIVALWMASIIGQCSDRSIVVPKR